MAGCMIVCEGWRVAVKVSERNKAEGRRYIAGANIATAIVLPAFLLTFVAHSSTTIAYAGWATGVVLVLMSVWLWGEQNGRRYDRWVAICAGCGLLLPVIVGATVVIPGSLVSASPQPLSRELILPIGIGAIFGAISLWTPAGLAEREALGRLWDERERLSFVDRQQTWNLLAITSGILMGLSGVIAMIAVVVGRDNEGALGFFASRCGVLAAFYIVVAGTAYAVARWRTNGSGPPT